MALCKIGEPAIDPILRLMHHPDPAMQERAALLLWKMGEPGAEALTAALETGWAGKR
jgi:hypothetical protein